MAKVRLEVDGAAFEVACEPGAEAKLRDLADLVDRRAGRLRAEGATGGQRLMLLTAMQIADELTLALDRARAAEDLAARLHDELTAVEAAAAETIETAMRRIESIMRRLDEPMARG